MNLLVILSLLFLPAYLIVMTLLKVNATMLVTERKEEEELMIESDLESEWEEEPDVIDYAMMGLLSV